MITQQDLKRLLHYDPETGVFTNKVARSPNALKQSRAGSLNKKLGYRQLYLKKKLYYEHRLVWLYLYNRWPKEQLDPKNQDRADNRLANLHETSRANNMRNLPKACTNTSGITGVYWNPTNKCWIARIQVNKVTIYLGSFASKSKAALARQTANHKYKFTKNHGV